MGCLDFLGPDTTAENVQRVLLHSEEIAYKKQLREPGKMGLMLYIPILTQLHWFLVINILKMRRAFLQELTKNCLSSWSLSLKDTIPGEFLLERKEIQEGLRKNM